MHPMMPCEYDNPDSEQVDDWLKHGQIGTQKWMVAFRTGELWPKGSAHHIIHLQRSLGSPIIAKSRWLPLKPWKPSMLRKTDLTIS